MAIVEINADVKLLVRSLERIATALEMLLLHHHGIDLRGIEQVEREAGTGEAAVTYADDASSAIVEANEELERLGVRPPTNEGTA